MFDDKTGHDTEKAGFFFEPGNERVLKILVQGADFFRKCRIPDLPFFKKGHGLTPVPAFVENPVQLARIQVKHPVLPSFLGYGKPVVNLPRVRHIDITSAGRNLFSPVVKSQAAFFNHANGNAFMEMGRKGLQAIGCVQQFKVSNIRKPLESDYIFRLSDIPSQTRLRPFAHILFYFIQPILSWIKLPFDF
jgi:hypothetical protein